MYTPTPSCCWLLQLPDYVLVCVCPLSGLSQVSHEHLAVALALEVPVVSLVRQKFGCHGRKKADRNPACVITTADVAPPEAVDQVLQDVR